MIMTIGNGKFEVGNFGQNRALVMYYDNSTLIDTLLSHVNTYHKKDDFLYVISEEGYAVVDGESNTCKLFVSVDKQFADRLNNPDENARIVALKSYDEFTEEEKNVFAKLTTKPTW